MFGTIAYNRPGFRQLTGTSTTRYLTQAYTYDRSYYEPIPGTFPTEYELIELHYDITINCYRKSGRCTYVENSNLDSGQLATMYSNLGSVSLGTAINSASGSGSDWTWSIDLYYPVTLSEDIDELEDMTAAAEALINAHEKDYFLQLAYPSYNNTQMAPFRTKASILAYADELDPAVYIASELTAHAYFTATGRWWTDPDAVDPFDPIDYPCTFTDEPLTVGGVNASVLNSLTRHFLLIGNGNLCATAYEQALDVTTGAPGTITDKCFGGSSGYLLFPLPTTTSIPYIYNDGVSGVYLSSPSTPSGSGDGCPCSSAP